MIRIFYYLITVSFLVGCSSTVDYRGKMPEPEKIAEIKIGQQSEEDVIALIGSPTSTSLYGPKKWYYIYKKTAKTSFFDPSTLEEKIVIVSFNDQGIVSDVVQMTPDGRIIDPVGKTTPTLGQDRPMLQQIFSNFGRFAKKAERK